MSEVPLYTATIEHALLGRCAVLVRVLPRRVYIGSRPAARPRLVRACPKVCAGHVVYV